MFRERVELPTMLRLSPRSLPSERRQQALITPSDARRRAQLRDVAIRVDDVCRTFEYLLPPPLSRLTTRLIYYMPLIHTPYSPIFVYAHATPGCLFTPAEADAADYATPHDEMPMMSLIDGVAPRS